MGTVKSTIYSTTAKEAMTQLNFSTDFQESQAVVTIDLVKSGTVVGTETYTINEENRIARIAIKSGEISSEGTITFATEGTAIAFSGICVSQNITSFRAENVAISYR